MSLRLFWCKKGLYNFTALLMDIFNVVPLIEYSHNKIISSILPQPLMLDVLQALQSSEYSYILNAAHSDTLAVILQNLFSFNTVFPHLVSSWCPKQKVLNCLYYVYALSFSRIATVASLPHQRSHYFLQMFLTALGLYHDPEDLTAEDIGTGYQWDTSR